MVATLQQVDQLVNVEAKGSGDMANEQKSFEMVASFYKQSQPGVTYILPDWRAHNLHQLMLFTYTYMHTYIYILYIYVYIHAYICIHTCIYVYTYIYIYIIKLYKRAAKFTNHRVALDWSQLFMIQWDNSIFLNVTKTSEYSWNWFTNKSW